MQEAQWTSPSPGRFVRGMGCGKWGWKLRLSRGSLGVSALSLGWRVAGGGWAPTPAQAPKSWTHCCAVRGLLRGLTAYQGRWEPGLTPRRPLWASVGSSVNGNDVPSPSPDMVRAGGEGSPATLWGSRWRSHHPGLLTPTRPQIVRQNRGRKACDRPVTKTKKKKKAEGTVFTEEDFQKFQQEYFGS